MRCASCRTTWRATATDDAVGETVAAIEAAPEPEPAAAPRRPSAKAGRKPGAGRPGLALPRRLPASVAAAIGLAALGLGALAGREAVVRHLPQAARLYAAIGLAVNLRGLAFADVAAYQTAGADGALVVEGDVVNATRRGVAVPDIVVEVRDAQGVSVYRWTAEAPRESLEPAESARFRARLSAPPAEGQRVLVRFASAASH